MRKKSGRITNIAMLAGYLLAMTPEAGATSSAPATPWSGITPEWALKMPPDTKNLNDEEYEEINSQLAPIDLESLDEDIKRFSHVVFPGFTMNPSVVEWTAFRVETDFIQLVTTSNALLNFETFLNSLQKENHDRDQKFGQEIKMTLNSFQSRIVGHIQNAVNRYEDVKDYLKTSSAKHLSSAEVKELFTKAYDSHVKLLQAAKEWIMDDFIPLLQSKRLLRNKE